MNKEQASAAYEREMGKGGEMIDTQTSEDKSQSPCRWCLNSSYFKRGSNIMREPCKTCVGTEAWDSFEFSGKDGHASREPKP